MADARQQTIKAVYEDPRTGFGSIDLTWRLARARDRTITRQEVASYINGLRVQRDRPQRGYNSYVPPLPMHQLQIDLADMKAFWSSPIPLHVRGRGRIHQESFRDTPERQESFKHRTRSSEGYKRTRNSCSHLQR